MPRQAKRQHLNIEALTPAPSNPPQHLPPIGYFPTTIGGAASPGRPRVVISEKFLTDPSVNEKYKIVLGICRTSSLNGDRALEMRDHLRKMLVMLRRHSQNRRENANCMLVALPCAVARSSRDGISRPGTISQHEHLWRCLNRIDARKKVVLFIRGLDGFTTNIGPSGWIRVLEMCTAKFDLEIVFQYSTRTTVNFQAGLPLVSEDGMPETLTIRGPKFLRAIRSYAAGTDDPQLEPELTVVHLMAGLDINKTDKNNQYNHSRNIVPPAV